MEQERRPRAFISCSLRNEDKAFVDFVVEIVRRFGFHPTGTVGRYAAAPKPVWKQIRDGIQSTDCIVLAATPRYIQQDINDKERTGKGISEMLHVEVGMAVATGRPVLVFVQEGTDVGSFLHQLVQYIVLNPNDKEDLKEKWPLIANYFRSALAMIQERWRQENRNDLLKLAGAVLTIIGVATVIGFLGGGDS